MNECQNCKKGKPHIIKCFSSDVEELMDRIQLEIEKDKRLKVMVTDEFEGMKHRKIKNRNIEE